MLNKRLAGDLRATLYLGFPAFALLFSILATFPSPPGISTVGKLPILSVLWTFSPAVSWGLAVFLLVLWLIDGAVLLNVFFHEDRLRSKSHPRAAMLSLAGLCSLLFILEVAGPSLRATTSLLGVYAVFGWLIAVIIALVAL
jgi:hypothetical protein